VRVLEPPGQDPLSIVRFAIEELDRDQEYDRAYCVFDRDGHANFDAAVRLARDSKYCVANKLFTITSVPCFELWILLHYCYSTAAYSAAGGSSACERAIRDVKQHCPDYAKGNKTIFNDLAGNVNQAIRNAQRLEKHNADTQTSNPATRMHQLVDYLVHLKT
jgi:RloB-like protein